MSVRWSWSRDGHDWPHRESSRFVRAAGLQWHVQCLGDGPVVLMLHGTGASSHSWRASLSRLARHFTVVVPDLPGHAFSEPMPQGRATLPDVARAVAGLLGALNVEPVLAVGHSAGAAVLARMALDGRLSARALVGVNAALLPFDGWAGFLYAPMARLLALNPVVPRLVAWRAGDRRSVQRLIDATGSHLDARGVEFYMRLMRSRSHVAGVLAMMAHWDLASLVRDLPGLTVPLHLVVAEGDRTVAPSQADTVAQRVPAARVQRLPGLGHLAHEEAPDLIVDCIEAAARDVGLAVTA